MFLEQTLHTGHSHRNKRYRAYADDFKPIDLIELRVFLGLMILRGVFRAAGECTDELWSPEHDRAVFGRTMSLSRFKLTIRKF